MTTDGGNNWTCPLSSNLIGYRSFTFINSQTGWLIGFHWDDIGGRGCYIYKTQNSGINWASQYVRTDTASPSLNSICFVDANTGYAVGYSGVIIKTTNSGVNWFIQPQLFGYNIFSVKFVNSNTGFLACSSGRIYKTTNSGINWSAQVIDTLAILRSISFVNSTTGWLAGDRGIIMKTTNCGVNWTSQVFTNYYYSSVYFVSPDNGWVVSSDGIIQHTSNGGASWSTQLSVSSYNLTCIYFVNNLTGWAGGSAPYPPLPPNIIGIRLNTTNGGNPAGIKQIGSEIPILFSLSQNYPNPFNPTTKIQFSIPPSKGVRGMGVILFIYDVLGREVATLVNEQLKPGSYEVEWDGSNYPSGVYFYKLITESFSNTKRMVLIK
jgi:photosystem II stability/assembly factor-like uncharacterized protein